MPAEKAGLKEGDQIVALDGKPVPGARTPWSKVSKSRKTSRSPSPFCAMASRKLVTVQPVLSDKRYRIGIGSMQMKVKTLPFAEAMQLSSA